MQWKWSSITDFDELHQLFVNPSGGKRLARIAITFVWKPMVKVATPLSLRSNTAYSYRPPQKAKVVQYVLCVKSVYALKNEDGEENLSQLSLELRETYQVQAFIDFSAVIGKGADRVCYPCEIEGNTS